MTNRRMHAHMEGIFLSPGHSLQPLAGNNKVIGICWLHPISQKV